MNSGTVREQRKELQYHRQFQRMYFKANDMDFVFQWLMGSAVHGGAGVGESFYTASRIKDGNPQSWEHEWSALAKRVQARAETALHMGHILSGQDAYLRAAVYYRAVLASSCPITQCLNLPLFKCRNASREAAVFSTHLLKGSRSPSKALACRGISRKRLRIMGLARHS